MRAQHLVIAIAAMVVGGGGEDLPPLQLLQDLLAARAIEKRITQDATQAAEHAGADQKAPQVRRQLIQDVAGQVLPGQLGPNAERFQDSSALHGRLAMGGEVKQLQPGGPAFGAAGELGKLLRRQGFSIEVTEQAFDLPRPKAQVVGADFQQGAGDAQTRQVEAGKRARPDQERDIRRRVVDQALERELGRTILEGMQVVDDQQRLLAGPGLKRPGRGLDRPPAAGQIAERADHGGLEVIEQGARLRVPALGAIPGDWNIGRGGEARQERALAGAGGCNDEANPVLPDPREQGIDPFAWQATAGAARPPSLIPRPWTPRSLPDPPRPVGPAWAGNAGFAITARPVSFPYKSCFLLLPVAPRSIPRQTTRRLPFVNIVVCHTVTN